MKTLREYMNQEQIAIYEELKKTPYNFYTNLDKTVFDNCRDMVDIIEKQERIKNVKEEFFSYDSKLKHIQELEEKLERAKKEIELIDKLEQAGIENVYQSMLRDRADEVKDNTDYYLEITKTNKPAVIHFMVYLKDNQVYLQDLNSSNGTIIERGLFKKYSVHSNYKIILKTGDRVIIGSNAFSVDLFYYDMSAI